jgi:2-polyprenyl-3-methyl-5-hydroxy-6-metoxy-1,4-benzoquinol methylase
MIPLILLTLCCVSPVAQASSVAPTPEQLKTYEAFRAWITQQPPDMQKASDDEVFRRYAAELKAHGSSENDAAATIELIKKLGDRGEIERWNRILTSPKAPFSRSPNAFLVEMIQGVKPGRSLDVGMGQGRNTIYLAQQGWDSVGFDPADRAVAAAQQQATAAGVKITTQVVREEDFDWGNAKWDLIVLSYVSTRAVADKTMRALRPGGMVIVEAFHRDATKDGPVGGAVVFDTNELLQLFKDLRVIRYEDTKAVSDFGLTETRVVRLAAIKP